MYSVWTYQLDDLDKLSLHREALSQWFDIADSDNARKEDVIYLDEEEVLSLSKQFLSFKKTLNHADHETLQAIHALNKLRKTFWLAHQKSEEKR